MAASPTHRFHFPVILLAATLIALWAMRSALTAGGPRHAPYSELVADVDAGKIAQAEMRPDEILATLRA